MHPGQSYSRGNGWRGRQDNGFQRGGRGRYGRGANFHSNPNTMDEPRSYPQSPTQRTDKNDVASWGKKELSALVKGFVDSTDTNELKFPPTLSPAQRQLVHQIAMRFNLDHKSHGVGLERALVLTKPMGTLQQRICDGVTSGQRVKTIDGYQGAQALPDDFLDVVTAGKVIEQLQVHQAKMYRDIRVEANRPLRKAKRLHVIEPGLQCPPKSTISVERYHELQHFRKSLPSYRQRDTIVNTVVNNDVVVVCGDTGCGKTTQIPQMLYDAGIFPQNSTVICTQPRRISALSVATRVAEERGEACGDSSGYIIRFENTTSSNTHILYATTGILLRRLHTEPELHGVSCVIVDEVHERDVETDFCLLLLRDRLAAQQRYSERFPVKLKVVVMSATVQIDALVNYFDGYNGNRPVPLVRIPGTLFPVEEYFLEDAINWVRADPKSVPTMSLLSVQQAPVAKQMPEAASGGHFENIKNTVFGSVDRDVESLIPYNLVCDLIVHMHNSRRNVLSESILVFLPGWQPINRVADLLRRSQVSSELSILMLHSSLTSAEQSRVFVPPPKRYRKVVLATSIAETSITIDDIVFVIDCGFSKGTSYDCTDNTASLRASLISKANGIQRKGRAGRCRAGICVHLLPKAVYENLAEFLPPEIVRSSLDEVCLQVKAIQPNEKCTTVLARAMSPPPEASVSHAVEFLTEIGAFTEEDECLTNLGRALSRLPVHPLLGKMLFSAACFGVLGTISTIAAGLSVKSPFIKPLKFQQPAARESRLRLDGNDLSDHLCIVKLYNEWIRCGRSFQYANDNFADPSSLKQVDRTKKQLMRLVLQSPLVAKMKNAVVNACRHDSNTGLSRLVMLWSLYPRIATVEYRANRSSNIPNVYCWDNKPAQISIGSALATRKKADIGSRSFIVYYERMQLECQLNLFDSSCISPVDVCLCLRQLTVLPLQQVPKLLLDDFESAQAPPKRLDLSSLPTELYSAMLFDGDKKFYVAPHCVARALQMARDCMDYYLALSIKELRADLFPESLISAIALAIGYPIRDEVTTSYSNVQGRAQPTDVFSAENRHAPLYTRQSSDSEDDGEDGPLICEDDDPEVLQLSACDKEKVIAAFGNLAVFRCDGANELLSAARVGEAQLKDEKDVAQANSDTAPRDIDNSPNEIDDDDDDDDGVILVPAGAL